MRQKILEKNKDSDNNAIELCYLLQKHEKYIN